MQVESQQKRRISSVEGLSLAEQQLMERIMVSVVWYLSWPKCGRWLHWPTDGSMCTYML